MAKYFVVEQTMETKTATVQTTHLVKTASRDPLHYKNVLRITDRLSRKTVAVTPDWQRLTTTPIGLIRTTQNGKILHFHVLSTLDRNVTTIPSKG